MDSHGASRHSSQRGPYRNTSNEDRALQDASQQSQPSQPIRFAPATQPPVSFRPMTLLPTTQSSTPSDNVAFGPAMQVAGPSQPTTLRSDSQASHALLPARSYPPTLVSSSGRIVRPRSMRPTLVDPTGSITFRETTRHGEHPRPRATHTVAPAIKALSDRLLQYGKSNRLRDAHKEIGDALELDKVSSQSFVTRTEGISTVSAEENSEELVSDLDILKGPRRDVASNLLNSSVFELHTQRRAKRMHRRLDNILPQRLKWWQRLGIEMGVKELSRNGRLFLGGQVFPGKTLQALFSGRIATDQLSPQYRVKPTVLLVPNTSI